jgi:hypothetical protein
MDTRYLESSQNELLKLLEFVCKNRNTKVTPSLLKNELFSDLEMEEIYALVLSIKYRKIKNITLIETIDEPESSYLQYHDGLEEYVFNLKTMIKKLKLHRIVAFLSTEYSSTKQSFDSEEIAKAFNPELSITETNRLCEVLIANEDVINAPTNQSESKGILNLVVTPGTRAVYANKKYLEEEVQIGIPILPTISAKFVNITMGLAALGLGYKVIHDNKIDNDEYNRASLTYRPELRIMKCKLTSFKVESLPIEITTDDLKKDTIERKIKSTDSVQFDIVFKNVGNYHANILIGLGTDTTTGDRFLDNFKNKSEFSNFIKKNKPAYYPDIQIRPEEEFTSRIKTKINFLSDKMFTFHIRIIYMNNTKNVYDTYSWYRGKINDFIFETYFNLKTGQLLNPKIENSEDIISFVDSNKVFYPYTKRESEKMLKYFPQFDK